MVNIGVGSILGLGAIILLVMCARFFKIYMHIQYFSKQTLRLLDHPASQGRYDMIYRAESARLATGIRISSSGGFRGGKGGANGG